MKQDSLQDNSLQQNSFHQDNLQQNTSFQQDSFQEDSLRLRKLPRQPSSTEPLELPACALCPRSFSFPSCQGAPYSTCQRGSARGNFSLTLYMSLSFVHGHLAQASELAFLKGALPASLAKFFFWGTKIEQKFFFSNFLGTSGISRQNPGISRQKSLIPWVSRDIPNFLAPNPSRGRPPPENIRAESSVAESWLA